MDGGFYKFVFLANILVEKKWAYQDILRFFFRFLGCLFGMWCGAFFSFFYNNSIAQIIVLGTYGDPKKSL